jgi:hypothetical protein
MLESKLKEVIKKKLTAQGWWVVGLIQTTENGIPDKMCLRQGRVVFLEFKRPGRWKADPLQKFRIEQLQKRGFEAYVVNDGAFDIPDHPESGWKYIEE